MSEIPSANDFLEYTGEEQNTKNFKLGVVTGLFDNGTAKIKFDGEDIASGKQYAYLAQYKPAVNDRVLLCAAGGTYIVMDKIQYGESPGNSGSGNFTTLNVTGSSELGGLKVSGNIGFFGAAPASKATVSPLTYMRTGETADNTYNEVEQRMLNHIKEDVTYLRYTLNAVLEALSQYGLV